MEKSDDDAFCFVLFGATGDLAFKKLIPALYQAIRFNSSLMGGKILCVARTDISEEEYLKQAKDYIIQSVAIDFEEQSWEKFSQMITYFPIDVTDVNSFWVIQEHIKNKTAIYYLSLTPTLFEITIKNLAANTLINQESRIVIEKPLGTDLASFQKLSSLISQYFLENQIFRIDHYLGKESVQNLMALRFGNRLFEPLWNRTHIKSVQITIAEKDGIGLRGQFYNETGAMRDMVQNHLLQLLCFVAMEPPYQLHPDAIRDEKLKVLKSLRYYSLTEVAENSVFGQYEAGIIDNHKVDSFLEEKDIPSQSSTETFFVGKMLIDNWRWAGVPFYVRTGKRLKEKKAEIVIYFRNIPHHLFNMPLNKRANKLVISLQPKDSMDLYLMAKPPGYSQDLKPVKLSLDFECQLSSRRPTAYERLLTDVIHNNISLFVRQDELEEAWRKIEPFLNYVSKNPKQVIPYMAGSWGPAETNQLILKDQDSWNDERY